MNIVVLVKEVPDTYGQRILNPETGLADRAAGEAVMDEIGERALEVALSYADANAGTAVSVLSMGPQSAANALRKALSMGAADAVHVLDDNLIGADLGLTAEVLAAAIRLSDFDLVITGNLSTDGSGGVLPSMLAELLGVPQLTNLGTVTIGEGELSGQRMTESGVASVRSALPAVVSITEALPEARFPSFKGIMAAKKKPFKTLTLADLGVDAGDESAGRSIVVAVAKKPAREAGVKMIDEGDAGERLAEFLVGNHLA